jgi:uncharacterized oligopeptide transporter (OPT) family protein
MLAAVSLLVLGPLGGVAAAYMTFSVGFFLQGQVLAGILGSTITQFYGPEGKHGGNYIQTMAAGVADMAAMAALIQAAVWLGMPLPASWKLMLYFGCIGMFAIGVGMLYTPVLVDRMQLEYPSGHAVANILRALTDPKLLRRSISKLGGGTFLGAAIGFVTAHLDWLRKLGLSAERVTRLDRLALSAGTIGAGMVVGSRITIPALLMSIIGWALTPYLRAIGWLGPDDPFRKIGFLIALAMIMGAAVVDLTLILVEAARRMRAGRGAAPAVPSASGGLSSGRLVVWIVGWGAALVLVATRLLGQPVGFVLLGVALSFVFVLVNGISAGITDSNPISSAFVVAVLLMSVLGLRDPGVGMMAATVLFVSCNIGVDMQQDRSTGWRLGTSRSMQFRYHAGGVAVGAVICVLLAALFMRSYPVLSIDTFANPKAHVGKWQSAMTYKFVGALRDIGHIPGYKAHALLIGLAIGFFTEVARKLLARWGRWRAFLARGRAGFVTGWLMDALILPSPYASSFGGFVELTTSIWFSVGGIISSALGMLAWLRPSKKSGDALPADMSTASLVGGGLIAGESLYTLAAGVIDLLSLMR